MDRLFVLDAGPSGGRAEDYRTVVAREFFDGEIGFVPDGEQASLVLTKGADAPVPILSLRASLDSSMRRTRSHVRAAERHVYLIWFVRRGWLRIGQTNGVGLFGPGAVVVLDSDEPFFSEALVEAGRGHCSLFAVIPAQLFRTYVPDIRGVAGAPFAARTADGRVLEQVLSVLYAEGDGLDRSAGRELLGIALKALRRLIDAVGCSAEPAVSMRQRRLRAVEAYIDGHLTDPRLSAATVADALGISSRYLSALVKDSDVSFLSLVNRKRQELVETWLSAPDAQHLLVGQIATMAGYRSLAQFGRAFRRRHGCAPTVYRRRSLGGGGTPGELMTSRIRADERGAPAT